tara:strand:+ start:252 stop:488 length:237 start_codon:yes stop_codon:yes gene_type:complete
MAKKRRMRKTGQFATSKPTTKKDEVSTTVETQEVVVAEVVEVPEVVAPEADVDLPKSSSKKKKSGSKKGWFSKKENDQ